MKFYKMRYQVPLHKSLNEYLPKINACYGENIFSERRYMTFRRYEINNILFHSVLSYVHNR